MGIGIIVIPNLKIFSEINFLGGVTNCDYKIIFK